MASVGDHVAATIDCFEKAQLDFAMLHACLAVDGTARKVYPGVGNRKRFVQFLRDYYWVIEPTAMPGFDLELSRFGNVPLGRNPRPDWAEIVYEVHRCAHAHGEDVRPGFRLTAGVGFSVKSGKLGDGVFEMPNNLPFGLLFASVLAPANATETVPNGYFLTIGSLDRADLMQLPIADWWGCEAEFRPIARRFNRVRVNFQL